MTRDANEIAKIVQDIALLQKWSEAYELADSYREKQQWRLAAVAFKRSIELKPNSFWSYHHLGDTLSQLKQWQQAAIAYRRGVQLDNSFFWSWHNLGNAYCKLQQWQSAVQAYGQAIRLDDQFFWSWYGRGNALVQLKQWDQAIANYLQAVQLEPEQQQVYQKLGAAFKQRSSLTQSIKDYRQIINSPPANSALQLLRDQPQKLLNLAHTFSSQHQINAAIIILYMLLEIQPNQAEILRQLSQLTNQNNQLTHQIAQQRQQLQEKQPSRLLTPSNKNKIKSLTKYPAGQITLQHNCLVLPNQLEDLCSAVGWNKRPREKVDTALKQSFGYVCAWYNHNKKQKLIGFGRTVADGAFNAMLLDILVHPDFQSQGIGKKVVNNLVQQLRQSEVTDITLLAAPHIVDFYHKLGFVSQPNNIQWMLWSEI